MKNELLHNNSIKLRAIEPEDIDQFYQWENDTSYWEQGNTIVPFSRYALKQYIEQASLDVYEIKEMRLIVERKEDAVCLGTIDVSNIDFFNKRAEMGVLIDKMHQKNGYAVMAIDILLTYLFTYLDLEQVFCHVPIHNIASQNMLLRAGFVCSGQKRNWIRKDSQFEDVLFYQKLR